MKAQHIDLNLSKETHREIYWRRVFAEFEFVSQSTVRRHARELVPTCDPVSRAEAIRIIYKHRLAKHYRPPETSNTGRGRGIHLSVADVKDIRASYDAEPDIKKIAERYKQATLDTITKIVKRKTYLNFE